MKAEISKPSFGPRPGTDLSKLDFISGTRLFVSETFVSSVIL